MAVALALVAADVAMEAVAPAALRRMVRLAQELPGACAAYVECHGAEHDGRADLLLCWTARDAFPVAAGEAWRIANGLQQARGVPGHDLNRSPLLWLEFDDADRWPRMPAPSACVCLEPRYLRRDRLLRASAEAAAIAASAARLAAVPEPDRERLAALLATLPDGARPIHVSFMSARVPAAVKLYARVPTASVLPWLRAHDWTGDAAALADALACWRRCDEAVHVDLSISGGRLLPRVGLAFPRGDDGQPLRGDALGGVCATFAGPDAVARVDAIARRWASPAARVLHPPEGGAWLVHRWIDLKLVLEAARFELKSYLAVLPRPAMLGGFGAN